MAAPRFLGVDGPFRVERLEWQALDEELLLVACAGRWPDEPPPPGRPVLVVRDPAARRFPALPALTPPVPESWRVHFALPALLAPALAEPLQLELGGLALALGPARPWEEDGTALLAQRRAEHAEGTIRELTARADEADALAAELAARLAAAEAAVAEVERREAEARAAAGERERELTGGAAAREAELAEIARRAEAELREAHGRAEAEAETRREAEAELERVGRRAEGELLAARQQAVAEAERRAELEVELSRRVREAEEVLGVRGEELRELRAHRDDLRRRLRALERAPRPAPGPADPAVLSRELALAAELTRSAAEGGEGEARSRPRAVRYTPFEGRRRWREPADGDEPRSGSRPVLAVVEAVPPPEPVPPVPPVPTVPPAASERLDAALARLRTEAAAPAPEGPAAAPAPPSAGGGLVGRLLRGHPALAARARRLRGRPGRPGRRA